MRSRYCCIILCLLVSMMASAQTQQGYVKTKGRLGNNGVVIAGTRLSGATITVKGGNTVLSGNNGTFSLLIPSSNYYLQNVQKQGYVLTDPDVLSRQYAYSKNPLVLVLEIPSQQTDDKLAAERKIRRTLQRQLQEKEDEIESLKEQKQLSEEEYRKQLQVLYSQQKSNEKLISDMADRYSKMDFDEVDEFNRRISQLILDGRLTDADSLLNTKGDINSRAATLRQHQEANAQAEQEIKKRQKKLEKSKALTQKELENLAQDCYSKFEIFKMQHQNDSAAFYIELRAQLDTMNVGWQDDAAVFLHRYVSEFSKSMEYAERALDITKKHFSGDKRILAKCLNTIGTIYDAIDSLKIAFTYFEKAVELLKESSVEDSLQMAVGLNNLGVVSRRLGEYDDAMAFFQGSLAIEEKNSKTTPTELADSYDNIGMVYYYQGQYQKSIEMFLKAVNLEQANTESLAKRYNSIGIAYEQIGEYAKALEYFKQSVEIKKDVLGAFHPSLANTLNNIGIVASRMDDKKMAEQYFEEALKIRHKIYGIKNQGVADSYNNLGILFYEQKKYQQALDYYTKALEIYETVLGKNHPRVAMSCNNIGLLCEKMNMHDSSLTYLLRGLEIRQTTFGEGHPNIADSYMNIAMVYFNRKNYSEALEYYEKSQSIYESVFSGRHKTLELVYENIAEVYSQMGKKHDALLYYQKALDAMPNTESKKNDEVLEKIETLKRKNS